MTNVKFIHCKTLLAFLDKLKKNEIDPLAITFILDVNYIWTHNTFYKGIPPLFDITLENKLDKLISEGDNQNIKTINGVNLLGKGNIDISGSGGTPTPGPENKAEVIEAESLLDVGNTVFAKYIYAYSLNVYFQGTAHLVINNWFLTLLEKIKTMYIILNNYKIKGDVDPMGYRIKIDRQNTKKGMFMNGSDENEIVIPTNSITVIKVAYCAGPVGYMVDISLEINTGKLY